MNKKLVALALGGAMLLASAASALAGELQCDVKSVDGKTVVLDCGRDAGKLSAGDKVQIKVSRDKGRGVVPGY